MSNPSPRRIAVEFTAENADEFSQKLNAILTLYGKLQRALPDVQSAIKNSGLSLSQQQHALDLVAQAADASAKQIDKLTGIQVLSNKVINETNKILREQAQAQSLAASAVKTPTTQAEQTGLSGRTAEQEKYLALQKQTEETDLINAKARAARMAAEQKQLEETALLQRAANQQAYTEGQRVVQSQIQQALTEKDYTTAIALNTKAQQEALAVGDKVRLAALQAQEARINTVAGASPITSYGRELGAVLSVAFAVNSAIDLISRSLTGKLTPAARESADAVRIIFDTALLGLSTGGVQGAVLGALGGAIAALGIIAAKTDPQVQALNDALDKLGKKDDAAQGLAKLAGVTDANAQAALDYLKANQDLAASFQGLVQNAQAPIPVLQGLGDAYRAIGDANHALFQGLQDAIPVYKAYGDAVSNLPQKLAAAAVYAETYKDAIASGKSIVQASIEATNAATSAYGAQAKATNDLAKQTQAYADIQNEINTTTARVTAEKAQETIDKLRLEGGSADELRLAYIKLAQAKRDAEGITPSFNGARAYAASPITSDASGLQAQQANNFSFLNDTATKLARSLLDIQQQYNDDSANLASDHAAKLDEIASSGYEQQVRLAREYNQRIAEIQAQYNQDVADAAADYAQRVADAEANVQERRTQIATDYADKRAQIEQDYQDKVAKIQSDYANSLFDIVAKDDAKGLVRARLTRDKQLADAAKQRDKENADADKQKAKQEKDLADALEKQKRQLAQDYERRLRDLKQSYDKQNATANQNYRDALSDLNNSIARQVSAENEGYRKRQEALDTANAKRKQSLIDALIQDKNLSEEYATAIIQSLRKILDPDQIIQLTNDLQKALDTKIEIKVTPNATSFTSSNGVAIEERNLTPRQSGGYIAQNEYAYLHAGETVLPRNPMRAYELAAQHMARVNLPATRTSSMWGGGKVTLYIDNSVNSKLLDSQIRVASIGVVTEVVRRALT